MGAGQILCIKKIAGHGRVKLGLMRPWCSFLNPVKSCKTTTNQKLWTTRQPVGAYYVAALPVGPCLDNNSRDAHDKAVSLSNRMNLYQAVRLFLCPSKSAYHDDLCNRRPGTGTQFTLKTETYCKFRVIARSKSRLLTREAKRPVWT